MFYEVMSPKNISMIKPLYPNIPETNFKIISPEWWSGYNKTKHDLPEGIKKAF